MHAHYPPSPIILVKRNEKIYNESFHHNIFYKIKNKTKQNQFVVITKLSEKTCPNITNIIFHF